MRDAIAQALVTLCEAGNWTQSGLITPDQAASSMSEAFAEYYLMPDPTGEIFSFAYPVSDLPSGALWCDGTAYATVDYPVLFGKIGYAFGGSGSMFNVPDLRGKVGVASGTGSGLTPRILGAQGGEENHILTASELAAHTHSEITAIATTIPGGLEVPVPSAIPSIGITGSTGDNTGHNTMQPFIVLNYAIITGQ
jgi:microcystin-dependent protein